MQNPVKDRIAKLRDEIAQISEANRLHLHGGKKKPQGAGGGSRTSASKIAGNSGRISGADRLEKAMNQGCWGNRGVFW